MNRCHRCDYPRVVDFGPNGIPLCDDCYQSYKERSTRAAESIAKRKSAGLQVGRKRVTDYPKVRHLRDTENLSLAELARRFGVTRGAIQRALNATDPNKQKR